MASENTGKEGRKDGVGSSGDSSPQPPNADTKFEEFTDMCSEIDVPSEHMRAAWLIIERLFKEHYKEMNDVGDRPWLACSLYVASCQDSNLQDKCIPSLLSILKAANIR